jgi:hypothetical protein
MTKHPEEKKRTMDLLSTLAFELNELENKVYTGKEIFSTQIEECFKRCKGYVSELRREVIFFGDE